MAANRLSRRTVLAFALTPAISAKAAQPAFAPSELGRQMLALIREGRAGHEINWEQYQRRYEELAYQILAQPISPSSVVDRALMMHYHDDAPSLSDWLPTSTAAVDYREDAARGHGLLAAVLALARLPVDM